ncbi:UNVERIFIED_CONTAM: hypothetical protein FKN15_006119 [Acipenser sinensis]
MASAGVLTEVKKITELRVIDLKTELKRRNLDVTGVKNVLVARLKQAIEKEGGDTDNIEITLSSDTPTKRTPKAKGKKQDADADATMEEESFSKQEAESLDQNGSDDPKDLEDSGDGEDENVNSSFEILESNPDSESKVEMEYLVKVIEEHVKTIYFFNPINFPVLNTQVLILIQEVDEEESRELLSDNDDHVITDEAEDEDNEKGGTSSSAGGSSGSTSGSSRNLWVSGLSSNTKAADLKNLFGKYGKVLSAKVVTNARSPGAKCYGIVTMSSSAEVARCISHIHRTELHGQQISVEKVKSDPFKKESAKKESEDKTNSSKTSGEKRTTTNVKSQTKTQVTSKKEEKKSEKSDKESKEVTKKQLTLCGPFIKCTKSPGKMVVIDQTKGDPVNRPRPMRRGRFDKVHPNMMPRRTRAFIPPEEVAILRNKGKFFPNNFRGGRQDILPFEKMKEQKMRDRLVRLERIHRAVELRRRREIAERERRERERIQMLREREERERLQRERERLEIERQKLERERMERERLERERIRIEQERRKEAERIAREREELRRQQEQLRYEQEKRNTLKRARDVDHRRDDPYWNDFISKKLCRRDHFESEQDGKKSRPAARRESSGFDNRYTKNYDARRTEQPRTEIHDTDRRVIRDRDERRVVPIPERPAGNRGHPTERGRIAEIPHGRSTRDSGPGGWKNEVIGEAKGDIRAAVRMRPERSGRDGLGPSIRGGTSATRSRDGGRGIVIGERVSSSTSFRPTQQKVSVYSVNFVQKTNLAIFRS